MPDPSVTAALAEAYALAPGDEVILHTLEIRHPLFHDDDGNLDSIWLVRDFKDHTATIEDDAPVRAGQAVLFVGYPFDFRLPPAENAPTPEIEISIDNVDRRIIEQFDLAVSDGNRITVCYRPFLLSDTSAPQMNPPPTFVLSDVKADSFAVRCRARLDIDLGGAFPRRLYTAADFPGLLGL